MTRVGGVMCVSAVLGGVKQVTAATVTGACVSPCESWRKTGCLLVGKKNGLAGMKTIEPEVQVPPLRSRVLGWPPTESAHGTLSLFLRGQGPSHEKRLSVPALSHLIAL